MRRILASTGSLIFGFLLKKRESLYDDNMPRTPRLHTCVQCLFVDNVPKIEWSGKQMGWRDGSYILLYLAYAKVINDLSSSCNTRSHDAHFLLGGQGVQYRTAFIRDYIIACSTRLYHAQFVREECTRNTAASDLDRLVRLFVYITYYFIYGVQNL